MPANYIIFHPENQRERVVVSATVMMNNQIIPNWQGEIYVDKRYFGNEDPYVFNNPWIYSYCHATQLRRMPNPQKPYINKGSWLFFVSCQSANQRILKFDTIFLVDSIHPWIHNPNLQLPKKYQYLIANKRDPLYRRHFKFPFQGQHKTVTFTYEAQLWIQNLANFSFLPYIENGDRVSFPTIQLGKKLENKIINKLKGKYPVELDYNEAKTILQKVSQLSSLKVLSDII
jgi:hypothetical protein